MHIEIDQSNKIEQTNKDTVIGASNGRSFTIVIPRKVKRKLQEEFRRSGMHRVFVYRAFVAGIVVLLKHFGHQDFGRIIIDVEYFGLERLLSSMFSEMWSRVSAREAVLEFKQIGKFSRAHGVSYAVAKGKKKPDWIVSYAEISKLAL